MTYKASGRSTLLGREDRTYLYGQIVDDSRGSGGGPPGTLVVGNQAAPIPIKLQPGPPTKTRELKLPLETIASLAGDQGYSLQIVTQSNLYDFQRADGVVEIESAKIALPIVR